MNDAHNPFSLEGKTIIVTGASSGIGQATAIECSRMGAKVILIARNEEKLQETFSRLNNESKHEYYSVDLTNFTELTALVNSVNNIDGVFLSAGKGLTLPVKFSDRDHFNEIFEINFFAQVELIRLLFKSKKLNRDASVVAVASIAGICGISPGNSIYGASKAALEAYMKYAAIEFAPRLIRVNCICPALVNTPLIKNGTITEEQMNEAVEKYPLKRFGRPEDIAYTAVFLLGDASSWITGTSIVIDGGNTI